MAVPASCACGMNKLSVSGQPSAVYRCHCTDCRRLLPKGEQYLHNACFAAEQVTVLQEDTEGRPATNPALVRVYCRSCDNLISNDKMGDDGKPARRNVAMANFRRAAADGAEPWPTTVDIWYSERVVDMDDDVPKWDRTVDEAVLTGGKTAGDK